MLPRFTRFRSKNRPKSTLTDAASFYETPLGQKTAALLNRRLSTLIPKSRRLLGLGYTAPYLPTTAGYALSARLPHPQTRATPPRHNPAPHTPDCLIDSTRLPFDDLSMNSVLLVHALEFAPSATDFLRAIWRVMADDGTLTLIIPNRSGLWAHTDATPFGHGAPFSTHQITRLLDQSLFRIEHHTGALMTPPPIFTHLPGIVPETFGKLTQYPCAGVHIVTARKNIYAGIPLLDEKARLPLPRGLVEAT